MMWSFKTETKTRKTSSRDQGSCLGNSCLLFGPHRLQETWTLAVDVPGVCQSVCLSHSFTKRGWTDRGPVWGGDSWEPNEHNNPNPLADSMQPLPYYFGSYFTLNSCFALLFANISSWLAIRRLCPSVAVNCHDWWRSAGGRMLALSYETSKHF